MNPGLEENQTSIGQDLKSQSMTVALAGGGGPSPAAAMAGGVASSLPFLVQPLFRLDTLASSPILAASAVRAGCTPSATLWSAYSLRLRQRLFRGLPVTYSMSQAAMLYSYAYMRQSSGRPGARGSDPFDAQGRPGSRGRSDTEHTLVAASVASGVVEAGVKTLVSSERLLSVFEESGSQMRHRAAPSLYALSRGFFHLCAYTVPGSLFFWCTYESARNLNMPAALAGGLCATAVTVVAFPLDSLQTQVRSYRPCAVPKRGGAGAVPDIAARVSFSGNTFRASVLKSFCSSALMMHTFETVVLVLAVE